MNVFSLKKMIIMVVLLAVSLSACATYQPLHGERGHHLELDKIEVAVIIEREGQILRNELIDNLNMYHVNMPHYKLFVTQTQRHVSLGINKDDDSVRAQVVTEAHYSLVNYQTGEELSSGVVRDIASYNRLTDQYGSHITQQNAEEVGLKGVADMITTELQLYFNGITDLETEIDAELRDAAETETD